MPLSTPRSHTSAHQTARYTFFASLLCLLALSGCNCEGPGTGNTPPGQDMTAKDDMGGGTSDMNVDPDMVSPADMKSPGDMTMPPADMPDEDTPPDEDMGGEDMRGEDMPGDVDMNPGELTCPADLRDSCIYEVLSCFGGSVEISECAHDPNLNRDEVVFKNGARGTYIERPMGMEVQREFRTVSEDGAMCFRALAQMNGDMPRNWSVTSGASGITYPMLLGEDEVQIICPDGQTEICSRAKFDLFYAWPDEFPQNCPDKDPDPGSCAFDADCPDGTLCCRPDANSPRQCLDDDVCLPGRPAVACETSADCSSGEECNRCNREGRECVPEGYSDDLGNALACAPDGCQPGDGTCAEPRVCCLLGGTFQCSVDSECDNAPDPNPVCSPADQQACVNPTQQCCYVSQLNEFRCIDENATCRTNVCFADSDCGSNEECCGANPMANTPGTCLPQCQNDPITCQADADCGSVGPGAICCQYPGYTVGRCAPGADDCIYFTCEMGPADCGPGETCCSAAPLTTPLCITGSQQCPPDP